MSFAAQQTIWGSKDRGKMWRCAEGCSETEWWDTKMTGEFQGRRMWSDARKNNSVCTQDDELWDADRIWWLEVLRYNVELCGSIGSVLSSDQKQVER